MTNECVLGVIAERAKMKKADSIRLAIIKSAEIKYWAVLAQAREDMKTAGDKFESDIKMADEKWTEALA